MDKEKLIKAKKLSGKIDDIIKAIGKIDSIKNNNQSIVVTDCNRSVIIPPELKKPIMAIIDDHYKSRLEKLEQEFEEL